MTILKWDTLPHGAQRLVLWVENTESDYRAVRHAISEGDANGFFLALANAAAAEGKYGDPITAKDAALAALWLSESLVEE